MSLDTNGAALNSLLTEINALPSSSDVKSGNLLQYIREELSVLTANRFDPSAYTADVVLDNTGEVVFSSSFCATGYIHCRKGQKIAVSRHRDNDPLSIVRSVEFFDIHKNRIAWASSTSLTDLGFIIKHDSSERDDALATNLTDGCYYVRIYFPKADLNHYMVQILDCHADIGTGNKEIAEYVPFRAEENPLRRDDFWYGKKIHFDGDGIISGHLNASRSYAHYASEALGCRLSDTAIVGSTLAVKRDSPTDRSPLIDRLDSLDDSADAVIINIGSNDWSCSWTPMGDMDSNDKYTFYGALKLMCEDLMVRFSGKPIVLCTPIKRVQKNGLSYIQKNSIGKTLKDYADAIKTVAEYYGIPVLDLYSECLINPLISNHISAYFSDDDGVFPNAKGHTIVARRLKGFLIRLVSPVRE